MGNVLSQIINNRYSNQFENIATDALVYILNESRKAKSGMMNILRGIVPTLPELEFQTQLRKKETQPDIWGMADFKEQVYIENKFWAGLTEQQPVTYLQNLSKAGKETLLLFVVPEMRVQPIKGELERRLKGAGINGIERENLPSGIVWAEDTKLGIAVALTSWQRLIGILEAEANDEKETVENLEQLRELCSLADNSAFRPFTVEFLNDQIIPGYFIQLGSLIVDIVKEANRKGIISTEGLTGSNVFGQFAKYFTFNNSQGPGCSLGENLDLWKKTGRSPLWLIFQNTSWGQAQKVKPLIQEWDKNNDLLIEPLKEGIAVAIDIPPFVDKDKAFEDILLQIKQLADIVKDLKREE